MSTETKKTASSIPSIPGLGITNDLRNLKQHGGATVAELREFLTKLKGRSPQEVIGIVSASMLVQSMVMATVITIAILAVFTITPYMIWGPQVAKPKPKTPAAAPATAAQPATGTPPVVASASNSGDKSGTTPSAEDAAKATKAMGMDETKTADPKGNPLEKEFDKLLDDVK